MKNEKENLRVALLKMASTEVFFIAISETELVPVVLYEDQEVCVELEFIQKLEGKDSLWKEARPFVWVYPYVKNSSFRILMNAKLLK